MGASTVAEGRSRVTSIVFVAMALTSLGAPQVLLNAAGAAYLLGNWGVEALPYAYLGAAAVMAPLGWLTAVAARRASPASLLIGVTALRIFAAAGLFALTLLGEDRIVGLAAPLWARVDLILGITALWRLAGRVFDAPTDRRWLAWLAAAEPVSTVMMGIMAPLAASLVGVGPMFLLAAIVLAASAPPAVLIRAELAGEGDKDLRKTRIRPPTRALSPSMRTYLFLVFGASAIWAVAHYQLDALFHGVIGLTFADPVEQFACFAYTLAGAGVFGAAFTVFGQGALLRTYGVRLLLILMPVLLVLLAGLGLAGAELTGAAGPFFAAAVAMKGVEYALVSGFYTRAWRALMSPFPETHRDRLVNLVGRNAQAAGAVGGAVSLMWLFSVYGFSPRDLVYAFLIVSGVGLVISVLVQRGFLAAVERALARRQSIEDIDIGASDRRSREIIQRMLLQGGTADAVEAARLHAALDVDGFVQMAPRMIARGDRSIVRALLDTVREIARPELYPPMAGRLTVEEDPALRDALLTAAAATGHPRSPRLLAKSLADAPDAPPLGALIGLGRHGGDYGVAVSRQFLERYALTGTAALDRVLDAARQIGPNAPSGPVAVGLRAEDPTLRRKAIRAAGKIGDPAFAPLLVEQLADPLEWRAATLALTALGAPAVPSLARAIGDRSLPFRQRAAAIRALGDIYEPEARAQLFLHAVSRDRRLRSYAHLALWRAGAVAGREHVGELLDYARSEMKAAAEMVLAARDLDGLDRPLLTAALRQRSRRSGLAAIRAGGLARPRRREVEIRLSALFGVARDWMNAAEAAEMLPDDLRRVFAHVAAPDDDRAIAALRDFAGVAERTPDDWLEAILSDARWATDWQKAVAYETVAADGRDRAQKLAPQAEASDGFLGVIAREIAARREGDKVMALNVVEKVLILKSADLFASVPDEDLAEIAPYLTPVYLDPGETIIREGEIGDELYIVVAGEVKVERGGAEITRLGERAVIGELAALDPEPRNASVSAVRPTQLLGLSNQHLLALFEANVEIASGVISSLIRRIRTSGY